MDTANYAANEDMEQAFIDAAGRLIAYLKESNRAEDAAGAFVMTAYVKQMEEKLDAAMQQMAEMKGQLDQMQQEQKRTTFAEYLTEASDKLSEQYGVMKKELLDIKVEMTEKATSIVEAVKQKGLQQLNRISEFFGLKEKLEGFCTKVKNALHKVNETVERIDSFGSRMRDAGREIANATRAFVGKEEKDYGEKRFSKTELVKKPFLAQKKLLEEVLIGAEKALDKCEQLSVRAEQKETLPAEKAEEKEPQKKQEEPIPFTKKAKSR